MAIITISRQFGSGGTEIATRVCELLQYRYLDKELMAQAAAEVGLSGGEVVDFSPESSRAKSFLDRLLFPGPHIVAQVAVRTQDKAGTETLTVEELDKEECLKLVQSAIHAEYRQGNAMIAGRGGQAVLQNMPATLHVHIVAPLAARLLRIQGRENVDVEAAHRMAVQRDRRKAAYLEEVFSIDWDDPMLYHLIINTGKWDIEAAAQIIVNAVRLLEGSD